MPRAVVYALMPGMYAYAQAYETAEVNLRRLWGDAAVDEARRLTVETAMSFPQAAKCVHDRLSQDGFRSIEEES
jgi:hypothetical protein